MDKRTRYIKISFITSLVSLIPIVPFYSLYLIAMYQKAIESLGLNCNQANAFLFSVSTLAILSYLIFVPKRAIKNIGKDYTGEFIMLCLLLYIIINSYVFQIRLGSTYLCGTDGQIIMDLIYSAPIASCSLIIFGLYINHRVEIHNSKNTQ